MKPHPKLDRTTPIDQDWIEDYIKQCLDVARGTPENSALHQIVLHRAEHVMDLVEAWQQRHIPIGER